MFPDRRPCFKREEPDWQDLGPGKSAQNLVIKTVPDERWSWWCFTSFDPPKRTICLHVMRGHDEKELRYDIEERLYRDKVVMKLARRPRDAYDIMIGDRMETWPEISRYVETMSAEMRELIQPHLR